MENKSKYLEECKRLNINPYPKFIALKEELFVNSPPSIHSLILSSEAEVRSLFLSGPSCIAIIDVERGGMYRNLQEFEHRDCEKVKQIKMQMDGNQVCAVWDDFISLQESKAGFGDTPGEAALELLIDTSKDIPSTMSKILTRLPQSIEESVLKPKGITWERPFGYIKDPTADGATVVEGSEILEILSQEIIQGKKG